MTPFDMIATTWRNRKTRILAPILAVVLLPVILGFILFHIATCIAYGVLVASLSFAWNVGEFNRDRRYLGLTFRKAVADRLRSWRADLVAYLHSGCVDVRDYISKRWRRVLAWLVLGPIILLIATPLVLLRAGLAKLAHWSDAGTDALFAPIKRHIGNPLYRWSAR